MSVYLDYDGKPTLARDLSWLELAPCGCAVGVCMADMTSQVLATAEQAWDFFHEIDTTAKAEEDRKLGYSVQLTPRSGAVDNLKGECPHEPQWGIEKLPVPDGYQWATTSRLRVYARDRQHLVSGHVISDPDDYTYMPRAREDKITSLCGSQSRHFWFAGEATDLSALARCTRCLKRAAAGGDA